MINTIFTVVILPSIIYLKYSDIATILQQLPSKGILLNWISKHYFITI